LRGSDGQDQLRGVCWL